MSLAIISVIGARWGAEADVTRQVERSGGAGRAAGPVR
jgi:hypothetical protein